MMADCTMKVFLFSNEKLEKHRHLKPLASHLDGVFICTFNHYCLFTQRSLQVLLLFFIYVYTNI